MTQRPLHLPSFTATPALRGAWLALALLAGLLLAPAAHASRDGDHERAREAVQAGEAMPLGDLLNQLERAHAGRVLEVELERDHGRWIYEIKLLQPDGRVVKRKLDARNGASLDTEGRSRRGRESDHENPAR